MNLPLINGDKPYKTELGFLYNTLVIKHKVIHSLLIHPSIDGYNYFENERDYWEE